VLEIPVRLRHRVRVDDQVFGHPSDGRQLLTGAEGADVDGVLHLLDELQVDRHARRWIGAKNHNCIT
jgi:hypothetical protein